MEPLSSNYSPYYPLSISASDKFGNATRFPRQRRQVRLTRGRTAESGVGQPAIQRKEGGVQIGERG